MNTLSCTNTATKSLLQMETNDLDTLYAHNLQIDDETGMKTIQCVKINHNELSPDEKRQLRVFYWAAFYGMRKFVQLMLIHHRWSPFIKSFKKRSVITGAVIGQQNSIVKMLLQEYQYTYIPGKVKKPKWLGKLDQFQIFGKDEDDNNLLHHSFKNDMPEVRQMLRDCGLFSK